MSKVRRFIDVYNKGYGVHFLCPGCGNRHMLPVENDEGPRWSFNGDYDKPTLQPSILQRSGHYNPHHQGPDCWCNYNERFPDNPTDFKCGVCHSFVTDGNIQFLSDCTHALAGQTIPLPEVER